MNYNRKYLCGSFLFHIIVFVLLYSVSLDNRVNKYTVLGVHSRKRTDVSYKDLRQVAKQIEKNNSNRILANKKQAAKKKSVNLKQKQKQRNKPIKKSKAKKEESKKTKKQATKVKKQEPKKQIPKKKEVQKKKPEVKKQDKRNAKSTQVKSIQNKLSQPKPEPVKPVFKEEPIEEVLEEEEILTFDLIYNSDPKIQEYHKSIQKTVNRLWRPPLGVAKGIESTFAFTIDKVGKIKSFDIVNKPKHFLYQSSITKVAKKFEFEKFFWGKKIIIVFRQ